MNVEEAVEDIRNRSLVGMPGEFARLVYLASTRDYNTGQHHHDGLESRFTQEVAEAALAWCHQEIFARLVQEPLDNLVDQLHAYFGSTGADREGILSFWKNLEPYRVLIPLGCDSLAGQFFLSNVRIALAILQARQEKDPGS